MKSASISSNFNITSNNFKNIFLNLLFSLIPLSYVFGNFIINLNVFILILATIIIYKKRVFEIKIYFLDKLLFIFFIFCFFSAAIGNIISLRTDGLENYDYTIFLKTILYARYLLFYFVLRFLIENKIIKFKWFFISCFVFTFFVCLDIFYQLIFSPETNWALKKDIFGFTSNHPRKITGPFGPEIIAGSYLQKFSIFGLFLFPFFFRLKRINLSIILLSLFIIYTITIILSGNRMALILFIFTILLILLFEKKTKKIIPPTLVIVSIIFFIFYSSNIHVKNNFNHLSTSITKLGKIIIADNFSKEKKVTWNDVPTYYHEFRNFYGTWLMNKYIGGGIRSYRHNCPDRKYIKYYERTTCNTHPHNYYLEILTDLGVIGFILVSLIFSNVIYNSLIRRYFLKSELNINNLIFPIIFIFIAEIFPIRVSGSFFTTATSTYIFLLLSFLVALTNDKYQN